MSKKGKSSLFGVGPYFVYGMAAVTAAGYDFIVPWTYLFRKETGLCDTCFLDWVLFANLPLFRLEGTEHMDEAYHHKWFHLKGMLFPGIVFALIPASLVGWLISVVR